ncbi:MAG: hypothetical protein VX938_04940, partial [Myxococcota bacterium]|nr:hypothetical protein [Myxococcota bacterium]
MSGFRRSFSSVFELDLRSLALFRVSVAALLVLDLILRFPELSMFYTDSGVIPRDAAMELFHAPGMWSLHYATGSALGQTLLFALALVFALGMMVGWRT